MKSGYETVTGKIHSKENGYGNGGKEIVTWYADLKGYLDMVEVTSLYGYGSFHLEPKNKIYSFTTTFYGHYVHNESSGVSIAVTYGSAGFSVSGSDYSELSNKFTISYRE